MNGRGAKKVIYLKHIATLRLPKHHNQQPTEARRIAHKTERMVQTATRIKNRFATKRSTKSTSRKMLSGKYLQANTLSIQANGLTTRILKPGSDKAVQILCRFCKNFSTLSCGLLACCLHLVSELIPSNSGNDCKGKLSL